MRSRTLGAAGLIFLVSGAAKAQSVGRMLYDDVRWVAQDVGAVWASPFRGDARDYAIAAGFIGGSAALSVLDDDVDRWAVASRDSWLFKAVRPVRRGGSAYTLHWAVPAAGGAYLLALATKNRGLRDGLIGCADAYAGSSSVRNFLLYPLIGRDRPDTVRFRAAGTSAPPAREGDQYHFHVPAHGWGTHSFPGGHVASVATCASFLMNRYDAKYLDVPLFALVGAMGVGRLGDRAHWLSDQALGVAMGYAIGKEVARRQLHRLEDERNAAAVNGPTASRRPLTGGFTLRWQATF